MNLIDGLSEEDRVNILNLSEDRVNILKEMRVIHINDPEE